MKLNPKAFVDLYQFHDRNFYMDPDTELYTYKGLLVKPQASLGLDCLYDVLNRMVLSADINRIKILSQDP